MVELRVFGKDFPDEAYNKMREVAAAVAEHYAGKVSIVECDFRSEDADNLGIGRAPALAIGDHVVAVGLVPALGQLIIKVGDALAGSPASADE